MKSTFPRSTRLAPRRAQADAPPGFTARGEGPPPADVAASAALVKAADAGGGHGSPAALLLRDDPIGRLPERAARKLLQLRSDEEDLATVIRELSERRRNAVQAKTEASLRIDRLRQE